MDHQSSCCCGSGGQPAAATAAPAAATRSGVRAGDCAHCGMAIPEERQAAGESFCCDACRDVSAKIRAAGLGRFYDLGRGGVAPPSDLRPDSFAWLDRLLEGETQAAATAAAAGGSPGPMRGAARSLTLDVQGVHCAACVWLLQELFSRTPGHVSLRINPAVGRAEITWTEGQGDLRTFLREAERFGYRFGPVRKAAPARSRGLLIRLGVCAAVAMNAMIFSLSFYFGLAPSDGILYPLFGWLNLALGTVALLVGGPVFFRPAWEGVRRGLAHLDLPISLGILLAWSGSVWGHLTQGPEAAYFDSLTIFVTLMVLGRWLQERVLERNRQALLASGGVDGLTARRRRAGRLESVPASSLRRGDEIWVVAGDLVSVDGVLLERAARVSLDWIDGESRPRDVEPGAVVRAGSFNAGDSPLRVTAAQDFADSRLVDLLAPKAREDTGPPTRWWHLVSTVYVTAVLVLAAAGFVAWQPAGLHRALAVAVSILVVTCPCALGLATPLAHDLVHGALRRRGVFLRDASFLDRALRIRKLLFDKTGTLTLGRIALTDGARADLAALPGPDRAVLYNLAVRSNHPVSRAIVATMERGDGVPELLSGADPVREIPGQGLEWRRDGRTWRLGRRAFALAEAPAAPVVAAGEGAGCGCGCGSPRPVPARTEEARAGACTLSVDGREIASLGFGEELRSDARSEIAALAKEGYEVHLLSGDAPDRVAGAAEALGIPADRAAGSLSPEDKAEIVRKLDARDTLMVGDGLNDGPSFAAAWTSATPAVDQAALPARADFYFLGGGIGAVRNALILARRLRRVIRDNLILAGVYNVGALALCFAGVVTPVWAAVLMPISSAGVVSLTAARMSERWLRWK